MNLRKLVCPYDTSLIRSFSRREIAVRVDSPLLVRDAADVVRALGNNLICVILDSTKPLDAAPLQNEWKGVPLALVTASVGKFREVVKKLPLLRELNIRVCLPASNENIRDVRILSSAGVPSTIMINGPEVDWDALSDLMTYSLFGRIPHAPIGPFDYIVHHYDSAPHLCWGAAFFEDPQQFFHIDNKRNVALSREELLAEKFIGCIDEVEKAGSREIENMTDAWKRVFTEKSTCATCAGFKLCLGIITPKNGQAKRCSAFFSEMLEALEDLRLMREKALAEQKTWRL